MTYRELYEKAAFDLEQNKITLGEFEERIKPLKAEIRQWIPVSEKLPEPRTAVLGYAPKYENVWALYYDSVCGWMIWSPTSNDYFPASQGEIVAWMPLPEPYKAGEQE